MSFSYTTFSSCVTDHWTLAIGDPNIMGWGVFAAYAMAAGYAFVVAWRAPFVPGHRRQEQVFWGLISLAMAALALNKQLDLQSLLTAAGRCLAQEQGWYEDRRIVQRDFIFAMIAWMTISAAALFWMLHGHVRQNRLPLLALGVLAAFVATRAMHLYHMIESDQPLVDWLSHAVPATLEILCPVLIILAAARLLRPPLQTPA